MTYQQRNDLHRCRKFILCVAGAFTGMQLVTPLDIRGDVITVVLWITVVMGVRSIQAVLRQGETS